MFTSFTIVYLGTQLSIVLSFTYSKLAGVNEGIITSIWAITPLFGALLDLLVFRVKLSGRHLAGVLTLVACAACISLSSLTEKNQITEELRTVHPGIPVAIATLGSVLMAVRSFQGKHMVV